MKDCVVASDEAPVCAKESDHNSLDNKKSLSEVQVSETEEKNKPKKHKRKLRDAAKTETSTNVVDSLDDTANSAITPKMNAFQFMMNSRHRSIGRNSPGRELDLNESLDSFVPKKDLKARKSRLEAWAESKGASKRKREYEEVGNCINRKLNQREKKLKKMLKIDCQSDDEVITKRRRKCTAIASDGEDSEDKVTKKGRGRLSLRKGAGDEEGGDLNLTPQSVKSWKFKIKICMDENKENGEANEGVDAVLDKNEMSDVHDVENEASASTVVLTDDKDVCVLTTGEAETEGRVLRRRSKPKTYDDYFLSDEDDTSEGKKKGKKALKVAPVFLKSVPKPKLDPKVIEARREFLLSGMPSSLKKELERQQCIEETDFDVFPTISHVQQKTPNNVFWDLPEVELKLTAPKEEKIEIEPFSKKLLSLEPSPDGAKVAGPSKVKNLKKIVKEIKAKNPDYPVFKIFNSIYSRSGYKLEKIEENEKSEPELKTAPKRRGRPRKNPEKPPPKPVVKKEDVDKYATWTEKYKPASSSDMVGNHNSLTSLKEWLTNWLKPDSKPKRSDSETEFDITDGDSRDSAKTFGNTVILRGPCGCGKTAAAYAVCNELGFSVLEVNASSRRTGKRLLQELQEATQSHQVCKSDNLLSFVKEKKASKPKMCVLLVEDVDVVFEQDEGFTSALCQIIATSKRPVILTATDEPCAAVQKVTNEHRTLVFSSPSFVSAVWLQIVCLVEGAYISAASVEELLGYNRGDIRRTLLQLQLLVADKSESEVADDEDSGSSDCGQGVHLDFVENCKTFSPPSCRDLATIWWNWPAILNLPETEESESDRQRLKLVADCYESLAFADVVCGENQFHESLERRWLSRPKDSLGLEENMAGYRDDGFCHDLAQTVLSGSIGLYKKKYGGQVSRLCLALPSTSAKRLRSKQLASEEKLQEIIPLSEFLARKAIALDYMSCLRTMARSEMERAANNTKRSNRFYHYLRSLGVRCSDANYKLACDVFKIDD